LQAPAFQVQLALQVSVSLPQLPQAMVCCAPGLHSPWPVQAPCIPQVQEAEQVSGAKPHRPQGTFWPVPGAHSPWPAQLPSCHRQPEEQVSVSVPQLPQASLRCWPGVHCGLVTQVLASQPPSPRQVSPGAQLPLPPTQRPPQLSLPPQATPVQVGVQQPPDTQTWPAPQTLPQVPGCQAQLGLHSSVSASHGPQPASWVVPG
jgi:hypothetical protein